MNINIKKLDPIIKLADSKDNSSDLFAYVSLKFIDEHERYFTVNGFTIRKSKFNGKPYLAVPSKRMPNNSFFKFVLVEKSLWREIEKEVIKRYEYESIPVIENG